jgi:CRISPR-associated protein Cmr4
MFSILTMYAVTPCHAGSGSSLGVIDLPIQRERHTQWPVIHASGLKGAMRAQFDHSKGSIQAGTSGNLTELIFGSETSEYAGSLAVSDARILAYPMRSSCAPFVWVTSPAVLSRLNRDLTYAGGSGDDLSPLDSLKKDEAVCVNGSFSDGTKVLLEDAEVTVQGKVSLPALSGFLQKAERLLIVHDEIFTYAVTCCTAVLAQIQIDQTTGTTKDGSLRYQEELPTDTIMYAIVNWGDSRNPGEQLQKRVIMEYVTKDAISTHLQVGGDETLGRGIFELDWKEV